MSARRNRARLDCRGIEAASPRVPRSLVGQVFERLTVVRAPRTAQDGRRGAVVALVAGRPSWTAAPSGGPHAVVRMPARRTRARGGTGTRPGRPEVRAAHRPRARRQPAGVVALSLRLWTGDDRGGPLPPVGCDAVVRMRRTRAREDGAPEPALRLGGARHLELAGVAVASIAGATWLRRSRRAARRWAGTGEQGDRPGRPGVRAPHGPRARGQHVPCTVARVVALSLRLRPGEVCAWHVPPRRQHAIVWMPARRTRAPARVKAPARAAVRHELAVAT